MLFRATCMLFSCFLRAVSCSLHVIRCMSLSRCSLNAALNISGSLATRRMPKRCATRTCVDVCRKTRTLSLCGGVSGEHHVLWRRVRERPFAVWRRVREALSMANTIDRALKQNRYIATLGTNQIAIPEVYIMI